MTIQEYFDNRFKNKKILILGFGREGESTLKVFKKYLPNQKIDIADKKISDDYLANLGSYDVVIKSPGIPNKITEIKSAISNGVTFTSQTEIFFDLVKGVVVGVTGTKGKSTTTSLIFNILKNSNKNVYLVGNLGIPAFDYLDKDSSETIFCFELSSHQLSNLNKSPHISVFLNIYPEHLDYYESYLDYFTAKANIANKQNTDDIFIYDGNFELISKLASSLKSKTVDINKFNLPEYKSSLLGKHNINNIKSAWLVAVELGIDEERIKYGVESFKPLDGRLEQVKDVNNVIFVNDTLATIPEATISAISSFQDYENITLILGGFDRGISLENLVKCLITSENVKNVILIGQTGKKIKKLLELEKYEFNVTDMGASDMSEIVKKAYGLTSPNGLVLLSPAATSFDMFKDYKDRGDRFKEAVNNLI